MQLEIADSWKNILQTEFDKPYFKDLTNFVDSEYKNHQCFPKRRRYFCSF